jgi:hypothetical protein
MAEINHDFASDLEQMEREKSIQYIASKPPSAVATGFCLECATPLSGGLRWCDADCRDDWQKRNPRR